MRSIGILSALALVLMTGALVAAKPSQATARAPSVDKEAIAQKLVNQCAGIQEGDLVQVYGDSRDLELLENIAVHVRKLGARELLMVGSDRLFRRLYDDVPAKFDSGLPAWDLKIAESATAVISVSSGEDPGLLAHVAPERFAARGKAGMSIGEVMLKRNVRQVSLGNGLYPTAALAKQFGMTKERLTKTFWDGVNVDYTQLQVTGAAVRKAFEGGKEIHITNPNGTDLRVRVEARPVFASDGVISADDVKKGGSACQVWLPAGEVYLTPVEGTAEGTVVVDQQYYQDKEILGMTATFKAGKLVSMTAKSGLAPLKALYDAANEGKDILGLIDVGINPNVSIPAGSKMLAWMPAGMVTVGFGNNYWAGGTSNSSFGWACYLPGSTLTIDGEPLVTKGKLADAMVSAR